MRRPGRGMAGGLGNAALADPQLPSADVIAADQRITAIAQALKDAGAARSMDQLRAAVFSALLTGLDHACISVAWLLRLARRGGRVRAGGCRCLPGPGAAARGRAGYPVVPDPDRPGRAGRGARLRLRRTGASHLRLPPAPGWCR